MQAYEILKAAGLPAGRNSILSLADRKRVALYYGMSTETDQGTIAAIKATADLYNDYLIVKSRRGVHSLPGGKIRIESRAETTSTIELPGTLVGPPNQGSTKAKTSA